MTDPVDTDATAELAALEMDLLRKDVAFWIKQADIWKRLANDERSVTDRLRAVIKNAPHELFCKSRSHVDGDQWATHPQACTCWKADAL